MRNRVIPAGWRTAGRFARHLRRINKAGQYGRTVRISHEESWRMARSSFWKLLGWKWLG